MKEQETHKRIIVNTPKKHRVSRIEQHYTKIVSAFVAMSIILIGCIVYFSFTKTVITLTVAPHTVDGSFTVNLADVDGKMFLTDVTSSETLSTFTTSTQQPAKAAGTVTIVNRYSQSQRLIATTRLLSSEGILFRTTESVTVPAGGSVDVPVIADQEGASGNIGPSRFEIVALWEGLKDKIYGTSTSAMTGGLISSASVTQNDIETAETSAASTLLSTAQRQFTTELAGRADLPEHVAYSSVTVIESTQKTTSSAQVGDTVDSLTVTVTGTAAIVALNNEKLITTISEHIRSKIPEGYQLQQSLNPDDLVVSLSALSAEESSTTLTVRIPYTLTLSTTHPKLQPKHLVNMTASAVTSYFAPLKEITQVDVQFSPFWLKVTPSLDNHITVQVQE